jgi:hypothetical protein
MQANFIVKSAHFAPFCDILRGARTLAGALPFAGKKPCRLSSPTTGSVKARRPFRPSPCGVLAKHVWLACGSAGFFVAASKPDEDHTWRLAMNGEWFKLTSAGVKWIRMCSRLEKDDLQ